VEPTFKPADRSDVERLLEMRRAFCRHEGLDLDDVRARAALAELLDAPALGRVWLICVNESDAVGYVVLAFGYSLEFDGRDAFVDELFVLEQHRGRGLGGRALRFVEETCASLGVRALHLEVDRGNARAQAVYRKAGFEDRNNFLLTKRTAPDSPIRD
jgi:GNAT superfamily N-acetyltransferase